jgi:hypothetical protein
MNSLKKRIKYIKEKSEVDVVIPNLDAELPLYVPRNGKIHH